MTSRVSNISWRNRRLARPGFYVMYVPARKYYRISSCNFKMHLKYLILNYDKRFERLETDRKTKDSGKTRPSSFGG